MIHPLCTPESTDDAYELIDFNILGAANTPAHTNAQTHKDLSFYTHA